MNRIESLVFGPALVLAFAAIGCGGGASAQWDPQTSSSLRAVPETMLQNLDAGNFGELLGKMDDDAIVLDLDENNHPVRYQGRANVTRYFGGLEQAMQAQGLKFKTAIARSDCTATPAVGYCVVEFDQSISSGGQTMGPFKFRSTIVARKIGDDWRWTHWHGSFREVPAPAPTAGAMTPASTASK